MVRSPSMPLPRRPAQIFCWDQFCLDVSISTRFAGQNQPGWYKVQFYIGFQLLPLTFQTHTHEVKDFCISLVGHQLLAKRGGQGLDEQKSARLREHGRAQLKYQLQDSVCVLCCISGVLGCVLFVFPVLFLWACRMRCGCQLLTSIPASCE